MTKTLFPVTDTLRRKQPAAQGIKARDGKQLVIRLATRLYAHLMRRVKDNHADVYPAK
jgi:hypothetical protein